MTRWSSASAVIVWVVCASVVPLSAGDWPQWRGPDRNGVSKETGWLTQWPSEGPKVAWKAKVGLGMSSFVVAGRSAVTMGHADERDTVFCFDADTGQEIWKHSYPAELGDNFFEGGTTGTPTIADDRVYSLSRWGDVFCFDAATGKVVWSKNVKTDSGARVPDWGFTGAPLVHGDRLILNVGEAGLALDRQTGAIVWKSGAKNAGYSTPLPLKHGAETVALLSSGQSYLAVNLRDGQPIWNVKWMTQYGVNAADPIIDGDRMFLSTGYGKGAALFRLGSGEPEQLWKGKTLRTQMNAAVFYKGYLYGVDGDTTEKASLKCIEFATGAEKWSQPGFGSGGLIVADGKLIALNGTGELLVAPATPEKFESIARAQVLGGKTWTAPVLANGRIYCRNTMGFVVCLDVRAP
ncbi:MAG TPA: alcohol dehydrogenase [Verrucomicrobiales bacterium]|nr:alcohol dehydrogenase [Verrucomicrobiales bacterium]